MSKEDIVINGVSLNELKRQRDSIRPGASALISEKIELAKSLTQTLVKSTNTEEIEQLAAQAYEALDSAKLVSGISGVNFYLPFYDSQNDYTEGETFSSMLEESDNEVLTENFKGGVKKLYNLFYEMESQSADWHASRC